MSALDDRGPGRLLPLLAVTALVIVGGVFLLVRRPAPKPPVVPAGPEFIVLLAPRGEVDTPPTRFEWQAVAGATHYSVRVEDADAVWPLFVRTTTEPLLLLDPTQAAALAPERVHDWQVQALDATGAILASGGSRFRVRGRAP